MQGTDAAGNPLTLSLSREGRGDLSPYGKQGHMAATQRNPDTGHVDRPGLQNFSLNGRTSSSIVQALRS
jgi:hypothetical protein